MKKGLFIVHFALSGVVFCLDFFGPSIFLLLKGPFSSLVPSSGVFFFFSFIYLFIYFIY
jgi:hypothetical protein